MSFAGLVGICGSALMSENAATANGDCATVTASEARNQGRSQAGLRTAAILVLVLGLDYELRVSHSPKLVQVHPLALVAFVHALRVDQVEQPVQAIAHRQHHAK